MELARVGALECIGLLVITYTCNYYARKFACDWLLWWLTGETANTKGSNQTLFLVSCNSLIAFFANPVTTQIFVVDTTMVLHFLA
jgi:hypothetical protein